MSDWRVTGSRGDPWRVTISHVGDGRVIHLHIGDVMVVLPVLEAHKLGSALHAASGLDENSAGGASTREGEDSSGAAPHPGASEGVATPPAEPVAADRQRIWGAIQAWTEMACRLDDDGGAVVTIEGSEFRPLSPFFDELHAMVFPDEYLTDDEVGGDPGGATDG